MKDFIHIILAGVTTGMIAFLGFLPSVHAETIVSDGFLQADTIWDEAHSPYLLDDVVTVPSGISLTIMPGVEVLASPSSQYDPYIYVNGKLIIKGSTTKHAQVGNVFGITIDHGSADFAYVDMTMRGSLMFVGAHGSISTSTVVRDSSSDSSEGISIQNSSVGISGSVISGHHDGMVIRDAGGIFQATIPRRMAWTGADRESIDVFRGLIAQAESLPSSVSITGSSLVDNSHASISNFTSSIVSAVHNWWGSADGPPILSSTDSSSNIHNGIRGLVSYNPWLGSDPATKNQSSCCSNILFLPGLEASRLYREESWPFGFGSTTNRLWEPNRNSDVRKLFLDQAGRSIDSSIYAGDPIGRALGMKDIYGSFMHMLDRLVSDGSIKAWRPFGYDWRSAIDQVVTHPTNRATSTESMIDAVKSLAHSSATGKVTIVAHSNGGLVAKYLVKVLTDRGESDLIDTVISVAVPYLGTPQAILGLLHGDNQSIFGGLILRQSVAKELGTNMPSAYSLLPSASYFTRILGPTIAFASTTEAVDTSQEQDSYISSHANTLLMAAAEAIHAILDPFLWPSTIARWAIVGWGNKTAKGLVYSAGGSYGATMTSMGDSTVVAPSATYNSGTVASLDLQAESISLGREYDHANILESSSTQSAIRDIVTETAGDRQNRTEDITKKLSNIPNITIGEPDYSKEATFLVVSTHSPVELHLYDSSGRHTGFAPLPTGTDEDIEDGLFQYVEKGIPGSSFEIYGDEDHPETYISVPDTGRKTYSVGVKGIGIGRFTYRVERIRGGEVLDSVDYSDIPVTPLTLASSTVTTATNIRLASSTPVLAVDIDGDGSVDVSVKPGTTVSRHDQLEYIRKYVKNLFGSSAEGTDIVKRIEHVEDSLENDRTGNVDRHVDRQMDAVREHVSHMKKRTLSEADKQQLLELIEIFLRQLEQ